MRPLHLRRPVVLLAIVLILAACGSDPASPERLVSIGSGLQGPAGFSATVYATGLAKVSALAVDAEGRLWAATADYADHGRDGLYLVPRAGADPVEVVRHLHTPLGLLWYGDTLFVSSRERVDAYGHFNGKTFTASRTVVTLPAGVGESNGLAISPEGRIMLGISAPCDACRPTSKWSASVVSFLPDGRDLRVEAHGIRAPIGLAYYPGTSDLLVSMNQRDDLGGATPGDWLSVVRQGQDWRFPECYGQAGAACTGAPQPLAVLDKHAAVSGVAIVTGQLGATVANAALVAEWAGGKVQRVALHHAQGSTIRATSGGDGGAVPFLTGLENPMGLQLSGDGALFVGDWKRGIIYRISAP